MVCCTWRRVVCGVGVVVLGWGGSALGQETCQTASVVSAGTPLVGNNGAAVTDEQNGLCATTSRDVWHQFVPSVSGLHTMSLCGSSFDTVLAIYEGCGQFPLACDDDSCGAQSQLVLPLNSGQPYWLRVGARGASASGGTYLLTITAPPGASPTGNGCGVPIALVPNQTVFATTAGATGTDQSATCGVNDRADVWFNHAPQVSGQYIIELCSTAFDTVLSVHNSCVFTQTLACNDDAEFSGCGGVGSRIVYNATAGQPFLVRVAGSGDSFGTFGITLYTARANDFCANAAPLTTGVPTAGLITPAVGTEVVSACGPSAGDVWYTYRATTSTPHTFSVCPADFPAMVSVYSVCPGLPGSQEIGCDTAACDGSGNGARVTVDLNVGDFYVIRVAGRVQGGGQAAWGNFSITAEVTPPPNDDCGSATTLEAGRPVESFTSGASGTDLTTCGTNDFRDVWYSFTPLQSGTYEFNTCGSAIDTTLALFSDCATQLACSDDEPAYCGAGSRSSQITRVLSAGTPYLVRVAAPNGLTGRFRLVVNRTPPSNDACPAATALALAVPAGVTLTGATGSGVIECSGADTADVFFSFIAPETRAYQIDTCGSAVQAALSVYETCPPARLVACATDDTGECGAAVGSAVKPVLRAGGQYIIRAAGMPGQTPGSLRILVTAVDPPNDLCDRATDVELDVPIVGSSRGASGTDLTPCGMNDTKDVWFRFVPELSGTHEFMTCEVGSPPLDTTLAVFAGCPGVAGASLVPIACNDDDPGACEGSARLSRVTARLEAGLAYLVRVAAFNATEGGFTLRVAHFRPPNDRCADAQVVGMGVYLYDNLGADTDPIIPDSSCGLPINPVLNDVWFRFNSPISGAVVASVCNSTFDTVMTAGLALNGCAAGSMPVVACNDDYDCDSNQATQNTQSRVAFGAVAGQSYLIRVGSRVGERGAGTLVISQAGASCPCDWNHTGGLSIQDLFDFLGSWFAGAGDFNNSGQTTIGDVFDFIECFLSPPAACGI